MYQPTNAPSMLFALEPRLLLSADIVALTIEAAIADSTPPSPPKINDLTQPVPSERSPTDLSRDPDAPPTLAVNGIARYGQTLQVDTSRLTGPNGGRVLAYRWQRLLPGESWSAIAGATEDSYILTTADIGRQLRVEVTMTDAGGQVETLHSAATAEVETAPIVTGVFLRPTLDGTDGIGDIEVSVRFPERVRVTGTPTLTLMIGDEQKTAQYVSSSDETTLVFRYRVMRGDAVPGGVGIVEMRLSLPEGASIRDRDGRDLVLGHVRVMADTENKVDTSVRSSSEEVRSKRGRRSTATDNVAPVVNVNDAPQAADDTVSAKPGQPRVMDPAELTENDKDPDGDKLTVTDVDNAVNGDVRIGSLLVQKEVKATSGQYLQSYDGQELPEGMVVQGMEIHYAVTLPAGHGLDEASTQYTFRFEKKQGDVKFLGTQGDTTNHFRADWYGENVIIIQAKDKDNKVIMVKDKVFVHFASRRVLGGDAEGLTEDQRNDAFRDEIHDIGNPQKGMAFLPRDHSRGDPVSEEMERGFYFVKEPRLFTTSKGTLLVTTHIGRRNGPGEVRVDTDSHIGQGIALSRSTDHGNSWDGQILTQQNRNHWGYTAMVEVEEDHNGKKVNAIYVYVSAGSWNHNVSRSWQPWNNVDYRGIYYFKSIDDGATWTEPIEHVGLNKVVLKGTKPVTRNGITYGNVPTGIGPTTNILKVPGLVLDGQTAPEGQGLLLHTYAWGYMFASIDGGTTWKKVADYNGCDDVVMLNEVAWEVLDNDNQDIYMLFRAGGSYKLEYVITKEMTSSTDKKHCGLTFRAKHNRSLENVPGNTAHHWMDVVPQGPDKGTLLFSTPGNRPAYKRYHAWLWVSREPITGEKTITSNLFHTPARVKHDIGWGQSAVEYLKSGLSNTRDMGKDAIVLVGESEPMHKDTHQIIDLKPDNILTSAKFADERLTATTFVLSREYLELLLNPVAGAGSSVTPPAVLYTGIVFTPDESGIAGSFEYTVSDGAATDTGAVTVGLNNAPGGSVALPGKTQVGDKLIADTGGITDSDGLTRAVFRYQWQRSTDGGVTWKDIIGEIFDDYTVMPADMEQQVRVLVRYRDDRGMAETVEGTGAAVVLSPTVVDTAITSSGPYKEGDFIEVAVTYNEAVVVDKTGGTPFLMLVVGATLRQAEYHLGSVSTELVFRYRVQSDETDTDGVSVRANSLTLNGGTIQNGAGNAAVLEHSKVVAVISQAVDTTPPVVESTAITALRPTIEVTVTYNEAVVVDTRVGTPSLTLVVGTTARQAEYHSGSDSTELVFQYRTQAGEIDRSALSVRANSLALNGGMLKDRAGNEAVLEHTAAYAIAPVLVTDAPPRKVNAAKLGEGVPLAVGPVRVTDDVVLQAPVSTGSAVDGVGFDLHQSYHGVTTVVIDGSTYALVPSRSRGLQIIDISDPSAPKATALIARGSGFTALTYPRAVATAVIGGKTYALVAASFSNGVQIIDISTPSSPKPVAAIIDGTKVGDASFTELRGAWGITTAVIGGKTYALVAAKDDSGVQIIDISNPSSPQPVAALEDNKGGFTELGGAVDITTVVIGSKTYALVAAADDDDDNDGVQIIDISDPSDPKAVAAIEHDSDFTELDGAWGITTAVIGGKTYALVTANSDDGVQIIDISNPSVPKAVAALEDEGDDNDSDFTELGGAFSITTAVIGVRTYALVAAYSDNGVQIIDISDPSTPKAVAALEDGKGGFDRLGGAVGVTTVTVAGRVYALVTAFSDNAVQFIELRILASIGSIKINTEGLGADTHEQLRYGAGATDFLAIGGEVNLDKTGVAIAGIDGLRLAWSASDKSITIRKADSNALTTIEAEAIIAALRYTHGDAANAGEGERVFTFVLRDTAGNATARDQQVGVSVEVDRVAPSVTNTAITSKGPYRLGNVIEVTVIYNEEVEVTGVPSLTLVVGSDDRQALYAGGTGSNRLVFRYTVQSGETDADGVVVTASSLVLNGGKISDKAGNAASLGHSAVTVASDQVVDTTVPVSISGIARQNEILMATAPGITDTGYQWQRELADGSWEPVLGETGATYRLVQADVGRRIRVRVTGTQSGRPVTFTSAVKGPVVNVDEPPQAAEDTVSAKPGQPRVMDPAELTENDKDPDGDKLTVTDVGSADNGVVSIGSLLVQKEVKAIPGQYLQSYDGHKLPEGIVVQGMEIHYAVTLPQNSGLDAASTKYTFRFEKKQGNVKFLGTQGEATNHFRADWYGENVIIIRAEDDDGKVIMVKDKVFVHFATRRVLGGDAEGLTEDQRNNMARDAIHDIGNPQRGMAFLPRDHNRGDPVSEEMERGFYFAKEPRLFTTSKGTLLVTNHIGRRSGPGEVRVNTDKHIGQGIALSRSTDHGHSWDGQILVQQNRNNWGYTGMVEVEEVHNGKKVDAIYVYASAGSFNHNIPPFWQPWNNVDYRGIYYFKSIDDGASWTEPIGHVGLNKVVLKGRKPVTRDGITYGNIPAGIHPSTNLLKVPGLVLDGQTAPEGQGLLLHTHGWSYLFASIDGGTTWKKVSDYNACSGVDMHNELAWAVLDNDAQDIYMLFRNSHGDYKREYVLTREMTSATGSGKHCGLTFRAKHDRSLGNVRARTVHHWLTVVPQGPDKGTLLFSSPGTRIAYHQRYHAWLWVSREPITGEKTITSNLFHTPVRVKQDVGWGQSAVEYLKSGLSNTRDMGKDAIVLVGESEPMHKDTHQIIDLKPDNILTGAKFADERFTTTTFVLSREYLELLLNPVAGAGSSVTPPAVLYTGIVFTPDESGIAGSFEYTVSDGAATATGTVTVGLNNAPGGSVALPGKTQVGDKLIADTSGITDSDGLTRAVFRYQWQRSTDGGSKWKDIIGEIFDDYTVMPADMEQQVRVLVRYRDDRGSAEAVTSTEAAVVLSPTVVNTAITSRGPYKAGDFIEVTVTYDEEVEVTGTPFLMLVVSATDREEAYHLVGATLRQAEYHSGSDSTELVFRYRVQSDETDTDGVVVRANSLTLNGGTIQDGEGHAAVLEHSKVVAASSQAVDTTAPVVESTAITARRPTIEVTVTYNEAVVVDAKDGTPSLTLLVGTTVRQAEYHSGSDSTELVFQYRAQAGETDRSALSVRANSLALNGGILKDRAGNEAVLEHTAAYAIAPVLVTDAPLRKVNAAKLGEGVPLATGAVRVTDDVVLQAPVSTGSAVDGVGFDLHQSYHGVTTVVIDGSTYALVPSRSRGLQIIDISDPSAPKATALIARGSGFTALTYPRAVATAVIGGKTYALVAASFSNGVQIIDISTPSSPKPVAAIIDGTKVGDASFTELRGAWGITTAVIGGKTYALVAAKDDSGVQIIDISNPSSPQPVAALEDNKGGFTELGGAVDITTVVIGSKTYALVAAADDDDDNDGVQIIDISDPSAPKAVAAIEHDSDFTELDGAFGITAAVIGGKTYALVTANSDDGVQIIDISNPSVPKAVAAIGHDSDFTELDGAFGITTAVIGGKTYALVAAYTDSGVQIIDISDPSAPKAVAALEDGKGGFDRLGGAVGVTTVTVEGRVYALVTAFSDNAVQFIELRILASIGSIKINTEGLGADTHEQLRYGAGLNDFLAIGGEVNIDKTGVAIAGIDGLRLAWSASDKSITIRKADSNALTTIEAEAIIAALRYTHGDAANAGEGERVFTFVLRDTAGNATARDQQVGVSVEVDRVAPSVTNTAITSKGPYRLGAAIEVTLTYNEAVVVDEADGTPSLMLVVGTTLRRAVYHSGSDSTELIFRYTAVVSETDGVVVTARRLVLNGGKISDKAGNVAVYTTAPVLVTDAPPRKVNAAKLGEGVPIATGVVRVTDDVVLQAPTAAGSAVDGAGFDLRQSYSGVTTVVIDGSTYALVPSRSRGLQIIDISNPSDPKATALIANRNGFTALTYPRSVATAVIGGKTYALVAASGSHGVQIIDISTPASPKPVAAIIDGTKVGDTSFTELRGAWGITTAVIGGKTYALVAANDDSGVQIIDISDPSSAQPVAALEDNKGGFTKLGGAVDITTVVIGGKTYALVAAAADDDDNDGVQIIDISDPSDPKAVAAITDGEKIGDASFTELDGAFGITTAVIGGKTYALVVAKDDSGVQIIDISTPSSPRPVAALDDGADGFDMLGGAFGITTAVIGGRTYALVASFNDDGVQIIDISTPSSPQPVAALEDGKGGFDKLNGAVGVTMVIVKGRVYALVASYSDAAVQFIELPVLESIASIKINTEGLEAADEQLLYGSGSDDFLLIGGANIDKMGVAIAGIDGLQLAWSANDNSITIRKVDNSALTTVQTEAIIAALRYTHGDAANAGEGERVFTFVLRDTAGNETASARQVGVSVEVDKTPPAAAPTLALNEDTGDSASDRVTSNGAFTVGGVETGASWEYSVNSGTDWTIGTDTGFTLSKGHYPIDAIQVRQTDEAGNTSPVSKNPTGITVDTSAPSVTRTAITSTGPYKAGDVIEVTVTYGETVVVDTMGGRPSLMLVVGTTNRQAEYHSGSGSTELVFRYTVVTSETDEDGASVTANSLSLNLGTIGDLAGNAASLGHGAVRAASD